MDNKFNFRYQPILNLLQGKFKTLLTTRVELNLQFTKFDLVQYQPSSE